MKGSDLMRKLTEKQIGDLESMWNEHGDVMCICGANVWKKAYRKGILTGALAAYVGIVMTGAAMIIHNAIGVAKDRKQKEELKEES